MENSNNNGKLIGALLLGAAIGGALGFLFAPAKGSETRKNILAKGEDLSDAVKEKLNILQDQVIQEIGKAKAKANELIENGTAIGDKFKANSN